MTRNKKCGTKEHPSPNIMAKLHQGVHSNQITPEITGDHGSPLCHAMLQWLTKANTGYCKS